MADLGATDVEMAEFFGVTEKTLNNWKTTQPGFLQSLKLGKESPDNRVEASLYRRALGYSHPAIKIMVVEGKTVREPYTEHYPPDTAACIFWLKNRRKDLWRDIQRNELTTPPGQPIETKRTYVPGSPDLLAHYYARMAEAAPAAGADPAAPEDLGPDGQPGDGPISDPSALPRGSVLSPR